VQQGYLSYWQQYWDTHPSVQGFPRPAAYGDLKCQPALAVHGDPTANPTTPPWQVMPFSGAIGQHGVHFFLTQDSDNAFGPKNVDEIDGQQWRFEVPMSAPKNVLTAYGLKFVQKAGKQTPEAFEEEPKNTLSMTFGAVPAEQAGLKPGEIVTEINGISVPDPKTAVALLAENTAGERIRLTVIDRTNGGLRRSYVFATMGANPTGDFAKIMTVKARPRPVLPSTTSRHCAGSAKTRDRPCRADTAKER
jgi:hypothetical protein